MSGDHNICYGKAVHVYKGRTVHRALTAHKTMCGNWWVALIIGPPASDMPDCKRCRRKMGLS